MSVTDEVSKGACSTWDPFTAKVCGQAMVPFVVCIAILKMLQASMAGKL